MKTIGVWPTLVYKDGQAALKFLTEGLGFTLIASYAVAWVHHGGFGGESVECRNVWRRVVHRGPAMRW
jgi:uncharacterized glyoxalase superfamily protein PhnB